MQVNIRFGNENLLGSCWARVMNKLLSIDGKAAVVVYFTLA
jgi:hypothetical protein